MTEHETVTKADVDSKVTTHEEKTTGVHGVEESTVCSETEADGKITTHKGDANAHHAQSHTLASHSTKAHTELTGVTANQHHTPPPTRIITSGSYTGNGAEDRQITIGFKCSMVIAISDTTEATKYWIWIVTPGKTMAVKGTATPTAGTTGSIILHGENGIIVDDDANVSGHLIHYWAVSE